VTTSETVWFPPPADLALPGDEVHVWRASLDLPASHVQDLQHTLAADELNRAARFHFQRDRRHFIVARGLLRAILGRTLGVAPGQLCFCYSPHAKPALAITPGQEPVNFNLSHSGGLVLYALTRRRQIGIDLERIRADLEIEPIAARFFSRREYTVLRALPGSVRLEAFFNCWTRKEAYIKARGEGLSLPLDRFDVSLVPGEPATLLSTRDDPQEATRWSLRALSPGPGYVAALAVEGRGWRLKCWQWPAEKDAC
jgi:4'-phosphopantetheinyl transferase